MGVFKLLHQELDISVNIDSQEGKRGIWGETKLYFLYIEGKEDKEKDTKETQREKESTQAPSSASEDKTENEKKDGFINSNTILKKTRQDPNYIPIHCRQIKIDPNTVSVNGTLTTLKIKNEGIEIV